MPLRKHVDRLRRVGRATLCDNYKVFAINAVINQNKMKTCYKAIYNCSQKLHTKNS